MNFRWLLTGVLVGTLCVTLCGTLCAQEKYRTWTSGKSEIEGKFLSWDEEKGTVRIKKKEGKTVRVSFKSLSEKDQKYVQSRDENTFPVEIRDLQRQIQGIEKQITQLEKGKHTGLKELEETVETTEVAYEEQKTARDEVWKMLDETTQDNLQKAIEKDPEKQATEFKELRPENVEFTKFLLCITAGQKTEQANVKYLEAKNELERRRGERSEKLETQKASLEEDLATQMEVYQEKAFLKILSRCKGFKKKEAQFPVDELTDQIEILKKQFKMKEEDAWALAEDVWDNGRPCLGKKRKTTRSSRVSSKIVEGTKAGERMVRKIGGVEYAFRWCPSGKFRMGADRSEANWQDPTSVKHGRRYSETPHEVELTKGFWILETEVTQLMWAKVMGTAPGQPKNPKCPVNNVDWETCVAFCTQLSKQMNATIQLPTEAQWEYACRAGTTGARSGNMDAIAWHSGNGGKTPHLVATKQPNPWGLYDMIGNVAEYCADGFDENFYQGSPSKDPIAPNAPQHVLRGGSFYADVITARSAFRSGIDRVTKEYIGFRIVLIP